MVRRWKIFLFIMLIFIFHINCAAQGQTTAFENLLHKNFETIKVGYIKGLAFVYEDIPNHKTGYGYEYMEFLSNYAHCKFEYVEAESWEDLISKLRNGEIDLAPDMPGDYRKLTDIKIRRTDHVVGRYPMELVAKEIKPHMKLGTAPFFHPIPTFPDVAAEEGFTYELINFPRITDIHRAYHEGKIDGYIDALIDTPSAKDVQTFFDRQSYRLMMLESRQELWSRINLAMEQLLLYQPNIRDRLNAQYFLTEGFPLTLTGSEKIYLENKKNLKAAIFLKHQPYAYHDEYGNLVGVMPEIILRMSEDLNIDIDIVETNSIQEAQDLISKGEIDFIVDCVCDFSWSQKFNVMPTKPFMNLEYVPVTRKDFEINPYKPMKIACVKELYNTKHYIEQHFPPDKRVYVDTIEQALEMVNAGAADVVYVQRNAAHSLIEKAETYMLEVKTASVYSEPRSLGVYVKSDPHLWHILNKEIGHLDPDWITNLVNMNQQTYTPFSLKWAIYHHPLRTLAVLAIILGASAAFFIYRARMRQRHFDLVEHMAYTDLRYDLPNVRWLEREVPPVVERLKSNEPNMKIFIVVFSMVSSAAATETQGHRLIDKQFKTMAENISHESPVIMTAAGIDIDHLICVCKSESVDKFVDWVKGVIDSNRYMSTVGEDTKIVLHTRAGIAPHEINIPVQQSVDRALIACHQVEHNNVKVFDEKLQETLTLNHTIEGRMEQALADGEFKAWYQPKYDIRTREIIGAEALVRWISPELGFMPPGKFIPLFERNGFVIQVDYHLLEVTCKLQRERLDAGLEVVPISVNQSRLHMTEEGYLDKIKRIVDTYKLPPGTIELEVTETMFGDFDAKSGQINAEHIINELHKMGFSVSVDDFGSGYSSFMMLGSLPMDVMKIDRSLLTGADKSPRLREILKNVIMLGNSLKMKVLCEGIETKEEEELLLELGCHYGQGYLNAKPMPMEEFIAFFEKRNAEVRG